MISFRLMMTFILMLLPLGIFAENVSYDADLTRKIAKIIHDSQQIKVGMTRADLLKIFTTEGGISSRSWRRYVYRTCPFIKVDVEFEPVGMEKDLLHEKESDKIVKISQPFLEFTVCD